MTTTVRIPVDLRAPDSGANAGNSFWIVNNLLAHDFGSWQFLPDVDGNVYGIAHVPKNMANVPNAKIVMILYTNNASGLITSMDVLTFAVAPDAESIDPASLVSVGVTDITMPSVTNTTKEQSFSIAADPVADDLMIVEIFHNGIKAEDTLITNTKLAEVYLEIDVTQ